MAKRKPLITPADRFSLTFCLAIMAHGILVLGVTFVPEDTSKRRFESMEITLVQQESLEAAEDAKVLAQANLQGGGDLPEENKSPTVPSAVPLPQETPKITATPVFEESPPPAQLATVTPDIAMETSVEPVDVVDKIAIESAEAEQRLAEEIDEKSAQVAMPQETAAEQIPEKDINERQVPEKPVLPKTPSAMSLMANSLEMASLSAHIERKLEAKASRPRKKFISANTRESKYAFYMKSWSDKVERVGNLNYPAAARKNKLSGSLRLDVALNQDGSIKQIVVTKSSGHQILDEAAIRIVKLAAPYAPFPDDIRSETDILHIIRTWRFSDSNRFK